LKEAVFRIWEVLTFFMIMDNSGTAIEQGGNRWIPDEDEVEVTRIQAPF